MQTKKPHVHPHPPLSWLPPCQEFPCSQASWSRKLATADHSSLDSFKVTSQKLSTPPCPTYPTKSWQGSGWGFPLTLISTYPCPLAERQKPTYLQLLTNKQALLPITLIPWVYPFIHTIVISINSAHTNRTTLKIQDERKAGFPED